MDVSLIDAFNCYSSYNSYFGFIVGFIMENNKLFFDFDFERMMEHMISNHSKLSALGNQMLESSRYLYEYIVAAE